MSPRKARQTRHSSAAKWIVAGVALLVLSVVAVGVWSLATTETEDMSTAKLGPRLEVAQERIDLGRQPFDKTVHAEFELKNTGDRTLTLDSSSPVRVLEGC
jgi:hypothetical protein